MSVVRHSVAQRSPDWFALRESRVGASQAKAVVSGKDTVGRRDLLVQLALARLGGTPRRSTFISEAMPHGIDTEEQARGVYEMVTGASVARVGYLTSDTWAGCGVSPDGVIGAEGLLEIKCPKDYTHWATLQRGLWEVAPDASPLEAIPTSYQPQLLHALLVSGARWIDFVSFSPSFPESMQLYVARVEREAVQEAITGYGEALTMFLEEVDATVTQMSSLIIS